MKTKSSIYTNSGKKRLVKELINQGMRNEIFKMQEKHTRFNMMIAGGKRTGKTSLMKLFMVLFENYVARMNDRSSLGQEISDFPIGSFQVKGKKDEYRLQKEGFDFRMFDKSGYDLLDKNYHLWLDDLLFDLKRRHKDYLDVSRLFYEDTSFSNLEVQKKLIKHDERIHLCLYFISPERPIRKFDIY